MVIIISYYHMSIVYSIDYIKSVEFRIDLPVETLDIINNLAITVGANTYSKTPIFLNKKKFDKPKKELSNWDDIRNFKKTNISVSNGVDKKIDELRGLLNKLTLNSYDKIKPKILEIIEVLVMNEDTEDKEQHQKPDDKSKIGNFIFDIASTNKFYSNLYAQLYSELITKYDILKPILDNNINNYLVLFDNIETGDPKVDYDKFCKINVINEKRKAMSLFITNLVKYDVINSDLIINLINKLQSLMNLILDNEEKKGTSEEIVENIYLLVINGIEFIKEEKQDLVILFSEYIKGFKDKKGISNKTKFKYMDIIDYIKKS